MSKKLYYHQKTLEEMTIQELQEQYNVNKNRLKIRTSFFGAVTIISCVINPLIAMIPLIIGVITSYWLLNNNKAIKEEMDKR